MAKINKDEQEATRNRLLEAAASVIIEKGYDSASMREIARAAGVGDATIYNYFSSKEKLVFGQFERIQKLAVEGYRTTPNLEKFSLAEKLHLLIDASLTNWLPLREYMQQIYAMPYFAILANAPAYQQTRLAFYKAANELLDSAIADGEMSEQPAREMIVRLLWDFQSGIHTFWLTDKSDFFNDTSQILDKSTDMVSTVLKSGLIAKGMDLVSFFFRTVIFNNAGLLAGVMATAKTPNSSGGKAYHD